MLSGVLYQAKSVNEEWFIKVHRVPENTVCVFDWFFLHSWPGHQLAVPVYWRTNTGRD